MAYEYDSLYRLSKEIISADGLSKETAYTYDAMGNRLTKTSDGVVTNYTYNVLNQLLSENDIAYTYDANGSQVSQQSPAKTAAYSYDQEGRLITAVVTAGGTTTTEEYRYNWTGIRTAKITDGVETKYLIDPNGSLSQVIAELDSAGNLVTFYTRGAELISLHRTGETRYYQYDANGTVRLLTDGAGAITDTYTYDAFGNLLGKTGATVNNYLYTGEQFDANTGFYYLRARYMNPSTGTFISMDPAQGSIFDPVSLHKYLYANANPVMNSDPSGRDTTKEEVMTAVAIASILVFSCASSMAYLELIRPANINLTGTIDMQSIINGLYDQDIFGNLSLNMIIAVRNAILAHINNQVMNWVNDNTGDTDTAIDGNPKPKPEPDVAGRGQSKGGHPPQTLEEELAVEEAMSNPAAGEPKLELSNDIRWPVSEGWVKTVTNVNGVEVHYQYNPRTGEVDDVKVK